jgi:glutathione S-transferase
MKLHWSGLSPFVRKVMIVAHEAGLADQIKLQRTTVAMTKPNLELLPDNPLNKIPTLILDDGTPLYDSRTICEYLDSLHRGAKLFPAEGAARWDALQRQSLGDGMLDALLLWRQERLKSAERQTPELIDAFALKIKTALQQLESRAKWLASRPFDIGQVTLGCTFAYLDVRFDDLEWRAKRPGLAAWHAEFESRPSARATKPDLANA